MSVQGYENVSCLLIKIICIFKLTGSKELLWLMKLKPHLTKKVSLFIYSSRDKKSPSANKSNFKVKHKIELNK